MKIMQEGYLNVQNFIKKETKYGFCNKINEI